MAVTVGIIGSGTAGLVSAHVLKQDGFQVTILSKDKTPGGVWARERLYPGLALNNVHGEYRFSSLPMAAPLNAEKTGGRLSGEDMCRYMTEFASRYLKGNIQYETEVLRVRRVDAEPRWRVAVRKPDGSEATMSFDKLVLCSGGCTVPKTPSYLSQDAALAAGFHGPVIHAINFGAQLESILDMSKAVEVGEPAKTIVVVGGAKSGQDMATCLAKEGRKVIMVFEKVDAYMGGAKPLPNFMRKSRLLSIFSASMDLPTRLERFLHTTNLGAKIFTAYDLPPDSPLRNAQSPFWTVRVNDEGVKRDDSFFSLCNAGKIQLLTPKKVSGFGPDGKSLRLSDGSLINADVVLVGTGYSSSWHNTFFDEATAEALGIQRHPPPASDTDEWSHYVTLENPPPAHTKEEQWASSIYRGIVPAKNILQRDFAINGAVMTANNGYAFELIAHWISSYFLADAMNLPPNPETAKREADRYANWTRKRWPDQLLYLNESFSAAVYFFTWPQYIDQLLADIRLPGMRSGGNWLTWPFKTIDVAEIANLKEERDDLRRKRKV
ncbi:FAD/NAD-P-binding domain-containing protein [Hymenopellis radicata]|nr:FAD/NAD-P-binding domain-containing protein [Hymenopellis radicata]